MKAIQTENPASIITLLTDFGNKDGFVATIKGVIYSINPVARIVDIAHEIPAQDIDAGAFILNSCHLYFPEGSIHVAVVDPGVGSERKILLVSAGNQFFIAPDNQLLKYIFARYETFTVIDVLNKKYFLDDVSKTFHGRDIFAPVAAHLSTGIPILEFGNIITEFDRGKIPKPSIVKNIISGSILHVDNFGNLITNITRKHIFGDKFTLKIKNHIINKISLSYSNVKPGETVALFGSSGFLEIGIRNGDASKKLSAGKNNSITIEIN